MRLGDLDALKATINSHYIISDTINAAIDNAPTIDPIHAAGGCRCRECRWYEANGVCGWTSSDTTKNLRDEDDFCSDGEPREDAHD